MVDLQNCQRDRIIFPCGCNSPRGITVTGKVCRVPRSTTKVVNHRRLGLAPGAAPGRRGAEGLSSAAQALAAAGYEHPYRVGARWPPPPRAGAPGLLLLRRRPREGGHAAEAL
jgi:hypothetical protein